MQPESIARIMDALEMMMSSSSVSRSRQAIKRYSLDPERIDEAMLAAINASLYLAADGDEQVAEGFNDDMATNSRNFGQQSSPVACA